MPSISKEFGVSFNGFSVDNDGNYFLADVQRPIKPKQNYTAQYLPGRSETVYGSGGYQDILVNVVVGIRYSNNEDRINKINAITKAWCFSESKLKLRHSAFYYAGKVLDEVGISEDGMYTLLTFPFICKPFMYSEAKEVTLAIDTSIDYKGDYKCQPIIKFSGNGAHTVVCNGSEFTVSCEGKNITVDCNKAIVYYDDYSNAMNNFDGDFITLNPESNNVIACISSSGSTAPTLIYQETNLVKLSYTEYSYTPSSGGSGGGGSGGGAVDEDTIVNVLKNKVISTLTTTVKTVVGAINSLKLLVDGAFNNATIIENRITFTKINGATKELEIPASAGGTSDYISLNNKPSINGVTLGGNKTSTDLGIASSNHTHTDKLDVSLKGVANGLAELDSNGKVLSNQLPSYVDDVIEGTLATFPSVGESGKIYVDTDTNMTYRWSGSIYVVISETISLGETSNTAYRGDRGKIAYDHSQSTHAPSTAQKNSDITKAEIEAKLVGEITSHTHPNDATKLDKTSVKNTLTETVQGNPLDATQGKILNDKINKATSLSISTDIATLGRGLYYGTNLINAPHTGSSLYVVDEINSTTKSIKAYGWGASGVNYYWTFVVSGTIQSWNKGVSDTTITEINNYLYGNGNLNKKETSMFVAGTETRGGFYRATNLTWVENATLGQTPWYSCIGYDYIKVKYHLANNGYSIVFKDSTGNIVKGIVCNTKKADWYSYIDIPYGMTQVSAGIVLDEIGQFDFRLGKSFTENTGNWFNGKTINFLGDSITIGRIPDTPTGTYMSRPYPTVVGEILKANVNNYGYSGSTLSAAFESMSTRCMTMNEADVIFVFGGVNDYIRSDCPLGTIADTTNATVYGALDVICSSLIQNYPRSIITFATPLHHKTGSTNGGGGYTLDKIAKAIKDVCAKYSIPVLDLYEQGGFYAENSIFRDANSYDGLHPNQTYHEMILARKIAAHFKSLII